MKKNQAKVKISYWGCEQASIHMTPKKSSVRKESWRHLQERFTTEACFFKIVQFGQT